MRVLFVGGTGNISTPLSHLLVERGVDLTLFNRGRSGIEIPGTRTLTGDIHNLEEAASLLEGCLFDCVVNWINYDVPDIERDLLLFRGRTGQYIFISTASAYQKPPSMPVITESTPLHNPFWEYSRRKITCEQRLMRAWADEKFPATIVRPSHTYDTMLPVAVGGGPTIIDRLRRSQPIIVHGDGTSLWTVTHADDFALGFAGLIGHPRAVGEAFHITSDEVLTWNQIYETIAAGLGVTPELVHVPSELIARVSPEFSGTLLGDKAHSALFDNRKIKSYVPAYQAVIPFHTGIRRTLAWFDADPERTRPDAHMTAAVERVLAAYNRAWDYPCG